jgi:hypothetical protein
MNGDSLCCRALWKGKSKAKKVTFNGADKREADLSPELRRMYSVRSGSKKRLKSCRRSREEYTYTESESCLR